MSAEQVAEKVGTSRITIRSYEKEDTYPNMEMLNRLANCYNVSSDFLLGRNPYPTAKLDIAKMCEYTGLNSYVFELLHQCKETHTPAILNNIISPPFFHEFQNYCNDITIYSWFDNRIKLIQERFIKVDQSNNETYRREAKKLLLHDSQECEHQKMRFENQAQKFLPKILNYVSDTSKNNPQNDAAKTFAMAVNIIKCEDIANEINPDVPGSGFISSVDIFLRNRGVEDGNDSEKE